MTDWLLKNLEKIYFQRSIFHWVKSYDRKYIINREIKFNCNVLCLLTFQLNVSRGSLASGFPVGALLTHIDIPDSTASLPHQPDSYGNPGGAHQPPSCWCVRAKMTSIPVWFESSQSRLEFLWFLHFTNVFCFVSSFAFHCCCGFSSESRWFGLMCKSCCQWDTSCISYFGFSPFAIYLVIQRVQNPLLFSWIIWTFH